MRVVKLAPEHGETATSLLQKSLTAPHPRLRERLLALALLMGGQPAKHVAPQVGRSRGTVEDWVRRFNAHGLAGLHPTFRGRPAHPSRAGAAEGYCPAAPAPSRA